MGRFPWEETLKASVNIQLVRIGLVTPVNREHGIGLNHIAPAHTTYSIPPDSRGYDAVLALYKKN
jgi:hypothetical protein